MDHDNQPIEPQPPQAPQSSQAPQSPINSSNQPLPKPLTATPPKRKRTGLVIGVVIGAILIIGAVSAALWYFLVWQSPQNMINNALMQAVAEKQFTANSKLKLTFASGVVEVDIKSATNAPLSRAEVNLKLSSSAIQKPISLKLEGVYGGNNTVFIKVIDLQKAVRGYIHVVIGESLGYGHEELEAEYLRMLDLVLTRMEGRWLKISLDDMKKESDNPEDIQCVERLIDKYDSQAMKRDIVKAYRESPVFAVKEGSRLPNRNGGKGFEVETTGLKGRIESFGRAFAKTDFGAQVKRCEDDMFLDDIFSVITDDDSVSTLKLWIKPLTHSLLAAEITVDDEDDKISASLTTEFDMGRVETITIPKDAIKLMDMIRELSESLGLADRSDADRF